MNFVHSKAYRVVAHILMCLMMWQMTYSAYALTPAQIEQHLNNTQLSDHEVTFGASVNLQSLDIQNAEVTFDQTELVYIRDRLSVLDSDITINSETAAIIVNGPVQLLSSNINANGDLSIAGHSIEARTLMHTFDVTGYVDNTDDNGVSYARVTGINADGSITLKAEADILLYGIKIKAGEDITINAGGNISVVTLVNAGNYNDADNLDQLSTIAPPETYDAIVNGQGDVSFIAGGNAVFSGVEVTSGSNILVQADGSIQITAIAVQTSTEEPGRTSQSIDYIVSKFGATESLSLIANGDIMIDSAELVASNGHLEILAGLGITVVDNQGVSQFTHTGKYGKTKVNESGYQTFAVRSLLDAGKTIKLHSLFGDVTLKAADIRSTEGTTVKADSGKVKLLMSVETDHYSYSSVKEDTWTTTTVSKGHTIETGVPNTIIGGFAVEALGGIEVEYEGLRNFENNFQCQKYLDDPANQANLKLGNQVVEGMDVCMQANVEALAQVPGLEWMGEVLIAASKNPDQVQWEKVKLEYDEWRKKNTNLSPAAMLVVMIAVSIIAAPAGAAMAGAVSAATSGAVATTGVIASAISAGTTTLISQVTLITTNGVLNGDSIGTMLDNIHSDETLKAVATSMITAGLLEAVNTEFFNEINPKSPLYSAANSENLNLLGQSVQTVTEVTVRTGVSNLMNGGNLDEFGEGFLYSLGSSVVNQLGADVAGDIGNADLNTLSKYFAHFALGCAVGVAQHGVEGSDGDKSGKACASGASGAVIGELSAEIYAEIVPFDTSNLDQWTNAGAGYAEIMSVLLVNAAGGDYQLAGLAGRNAAENNALSWVERFKHLQKAAACFSGQSDGMTACMQQAGLDAWNESKENDSAIREGFVEGLNDAVEGYTELPDQLKDFAGLIMAGEFNTILAGLIASVKEMPEALQESLQTHLDSAVKFIATAKNKEDYQQVGKSMASIAIVLAETASGAGAAALAAKGAKVSIEAVAKGINGNRQLSEYDDLESLIEAQQDIQSYNEFVLDPEFEYAEGINFKNRYEGDNGDGHYIVENSFAEHLANGEGIQGRQIKGCHNENCFNQLVGESQKIYIADEVNLSSDMGLKEITYQVINDDGSLKKPLVKTTYNPTKVVENAGDYDPVMHGSIDDYANKLMAEYAQKAASQGYTEAVSRYLVSPDKQ